MQQKDLTNILEFSKVITLENRIKELQNENT